MDKPKILVVDDDEGIRTQLKWALNKHYTMLLNVTSMHANIDREI